MSGTINGCQTNNLTFSKCDYHTTEAKSCKYRREHKHEEPCNAIIDLWYLMTIDNETNDAVKVKE